MKAILIARVSTEEQKEAGNSLPAQVARLEKYCQNKEFEILKSCSFDESAYKSKRDEFDLIIDFVLDQKEKVAVCCDKVDRLSRNVFDKRVAELYEKALKDEVELHFVSDGQIINSRISAVEKFQFSISLGLAKYYSDAISDNVKRAQEQKLRKGEWLSKAPFGYKNITLTNGNTDIIVDKHNAHIIKQVFEWYATGAFSMQLLCKKIETEFSLSWPKGYLGKLLKNPFYHGVMIVKSKMYPHRYPPVISKSLFDEVQSVKNKFKKKSFKYAGLPYFYRGLIKCADCGFSISPERHKGHVYYHCTEYGGKHGAKWIREKDITKQLGELFKSLQMPLNIRNQIVNTLKKVHENKMEFHNSQFNKLTKKQKELTKMMDNLYLDKLKGKIDEKKFDSFHELFIKEKENINSRLMQLQDAENNYYITAKYVLELTNKAHDLFLGSEVEERRQLLTLVLQNLKLDGKKVLWELQKPFDLMVKATDSNQWRG
ncbi:recombinase family protein [bacterium]|nr:recombinase family protein [bacterium]